MKFFDFLLKRKRYFVSFDWRREDGVAMSSYRVLSASGWDDAYNQVLHIVSAEKGSDLMIINFAKL